MNFEINLFKIKIFEFIFDQKVFVFENFWTWPSIDPPDDSLFCGFLPTCITVRKFSILF